MPTRSATPPPLEVPTIPGGDTEGPPTAGSSEGNGNKCEAEALGWAEPYDPNTPWADDEPEIDWSGGAEGDDPGDQPSNNPSRYIPPHERRSATPSSMFQSAIPNSSNGCSPNLVIGPTPGQYQPPGGAAHSPTCSSGGSHAASTPTSASASPTSLATLAQPVPPHQQPQNQQQQQQGGAGKGGKHNNRPAPLGIGGAQCQQQQPGAAQPCMQPVQMVPNQQFQAIPVQNGQSGQPQMMPIVCVVMPANNMGTQSAPCSPMSPNVVMRPFPQPTGQIAQMVPVQQVQTMKQGQYQTVTPMAPSPTAGQAGQQVMPFTMCQQGGVFQMVNPQQTQSQSPQAPVAGGAVPQQQQPQQQPQQQQQQQQQQTTVAQTQPQTQVQSQAQAAPQPHSTPAPQHPHPAPQGPPSPANMPLLQPVTAPTTMRPHAPPNASPQAPLTQTCQKVNAINPAWRPVQQAAPAPATTRRGGRDNKGASDGNTLPTHFLERSANQTA